MSNNASATVVKEAESHRPASRVRKCWRVLFKIFRTALVILIFVIAAAAIYFNQAGLPETIRNRLTANLRANGWEVQYSKVRLSLRRAGVIVENLYLHRTNMWSGPQIYVQKARCTFRRDDLKALRFKVDSAMLGGGRLLWAMEKTNRLQSTFVLNNVEGELFFRPNDTWDLKNLNGTFLGLQLNVSGVVSNGSLIRDWKFPARQKHPPTADAYARWSRILNLADQVRVSRGPQVTAQFSGDASDLQTFQSSVLVYLPEFASPWGQGTNLLLSAISQPLKPNERGVEMDCVVETVQSRWITARELHFRTSNGFSGWALSTNLTMRIEAAAAENSRGKAERLSGTCTVHVPTNGAPRSSEWRLKAAQVESEWGKTKQIDLSADVRHGTTNWTPTMISNEVRLAKIQSKWGDADSLRGRSQMRWCDVDTQFSLANAVWTNLLSKVAIESDLSIKQAGARGVHADSLSVKADWSEPKLSCQIDGAIEQGQLHAGAVLDSGTGEIAFKANSNVDPNRVSAFLTTNAANFLSSYTWQKAPVGQAEGSIRVLTWTNLAANFRTQILPTAYLRGEFDIGPCTYRTVPFDSARSPFWFSNSTFCLPELTVTRPEGTANGVYTSHPQTKDFHWRLRSRINPKVLRPLCEKENQRQIFDMGEFSSPPLVSAEVWGRWYDLDRLGIKAEAEASNFQVRGQDVQYCKTIIEYTNRVLSFVDPVVQRPNERGTASRVTIDFANERIFFTNVQGNLDPYAVAAAISTNTSNAIAPYQFAVPPEIKLNGALDFHRGGTGDDMHFAISGGRFFWDPFHVEKIGGQLHWIGRTVLLSDMVALLHRGEARGDAKFEIPASGGARFAFNTQWTDVDLHSLMTDFTTKSNRLEGILRGELQITSASTGNPKSWQGRGLVELKDGLLWDIPLFGVFSPVLNAFAPGLGNSRAREAAATYVITNSVVVTPNLEVRATAMRMQFDGTIDFERNLHGRMEAELLRDMPAIGIVISKILWPVSKLFEYRITGTLQDPKTEPVYIIPKLLMLPFQPFKTIKDLLIPNDSAPKK